MPVPPSQSPGGDLPTAEHWLDADRLRLYSRTVLVLYVLLTAIWIALVDDGLAPNSKPLGEDFIAFWSAARLALDGSPQAAYDLVRLFEVQQALFPALRQPNAWQYPPGFLLLVMPLALLPYLTGYLLFTLSTFAAFAALLRRIAPAGAGLVLLLAFPGTYQNALHGQNGFLTAALIGAGLYWLPARPLLAGAMFGLLSIKPHLGLLLPVALLAGRHWRALAAAGLTALLLLLVSLAVLGVEVLPAFLARLPVVADWVASNALPLNKMPTLFSLARLLDAPVPFAYGLQALGALAVIAATGWLWSRREVAPDLKAAALVAGSLLLSPYLYDYDLVWLALPLAWYGGHALRHGWHRGEREWLLAMWLLPALVAPLFAVLRIQLAPLLLFGFFILIVRRALADGAGIVPAGR